MDPVLSFEDVSFRRNGKEILSGIDWQVTPEQRWVILGPNGAGKSTLLKLAGALEHPSSGVVRVLGERMGRVDVFELRNRVGVASTAQARRIPVDETVRDMVLTAAYGVTGRWREYYDDLDLRRALRVLEEWELGPLADRAFGTLSDGEQKRAQIARAVMTDPELLLMDEPAASLDLGARERLVALLGGYASAPSAPAMVMVTHHVEEIPVGFTHALLISRGRIVSSGPIGQALSAAALSAAFELDVTLEQREGRFAARARIAL